METKKTIKYPEYLKHYTNLPALMNILHSGELKLNKVHDKFDDKNDFAALDAYRRVKGAEKVCLLCFASDLEMVHHWFYYGKGKCCCCIMFNSRKLVDYIESQGHYLHGEVIYLPAKDITREKLDSCKLNEIPFIKRRPYECEQEYRVIWTGAEKEEAPVIPIKEFITNVTIGPDFSGSGADDMASILSDHYKIQVNRSRILEEEDWISKFMNYK